MVEASDLPALVKASIDGDEAAWAEARRPFLLY